jgi:hypothetical protein
MVLVLTYVIFMVSVHSLSNPHGTFFALEKLDYLMMSFSFLFISKVFSKIKLVGGFIQWIFSIPFILLIVSFAYITMKIWL